MQTERVTFLTSRDHKAALDDFAHDSGMSVGHVVREATSKFIAQPSEQEEVELAALVAQVNEALPKMHASLNRMIATLDRSHQETDAFLRKMGVR